MFRKTLVDTRSSLSKLILKSPNNAHNLFSLLMISKVEYNASLNVFISESGGL